jgi:DNA polymerase-3 subunit delta
MTVLSKIRRYYLFYGEEEFLKCQRIKSLIALTVNKGFEDFDCNHFQGRGLDATLLVNSASSPPMGSPLRVVVLRDIDKVSTKGQELIERFIPHIPEYTTLVMTSEKADLRKKLFKTILADKKACFKFDEPTHAEAMEIVQQAASELKAQFEPQAISYLVETVGCFPGRLEQEVNKLASYVGEEKIIKKSDIAEMSGAGVAGTISDLPEKIATEDMAGALVLLNRLLMAKESEGTILFRLREYFLMLNAAKSMGVPGFTLARILFINAAMAENLSQIAKKLSSECIIDCIHLTYEGEIGLKSAGLSKDIILFELVNRLGLAIKRGIK